jgi:hypothetical protein
VGSGGPDPEDVEWLDGEEPRGRVRQVIERRLATRRGRAGLAVLTTAAVALAVTGAVLAWPDEPTPEPAAAAAAQHRQPATGGEEVPSSRRDGHEPVVMWRLVRQFDGSVASAPRFRLVNVASEPQRPVGIRVRGRFHDADGLAFRSMCRAPGRPTAGPFPVVPGSKVDVVCKDLTEYGGREPRLDRSSLRVAPTMVPCESGGRGGSY